MFKMVGFQYGFTFPKRKSRLADALWHKIACLPLSPAQPMANALTAPKMQQIEIPLSYELATHDPALLIPNSSLLLQSYSFKTPKIRQMILVFLYRSLNISCLYRASGDIR